MFCGWGEEVDETQITTTNCMDCNQEIRVAKDFLQYYLKHTEKFVCKKCKVKELLNRSIKNMKQDGADNNANL